MRTVRQSGWWRRAARPAVALTLIAGLGGACADLPGGAPPAGWDDAFRHPELPERTAPAGTYPWVEPDDPSAVKVSVAGGLMNAVVVGDVIVVADRVEGVPAGSTGALGVRVRGVDPEGHTLFTGPVLAAESGLSDGPGLHLLGDGPGLRVAFSYHKTGPGGRLTYVDIYDPSARGHVRPRTVRLPTDEQLEWAGDTAFQGALLDDGGPITILDADGTLSPWHRPGWSPVAATGDVVVDAHRSDDSRHQGFEVVDRRTGRVLWSGRGQTVYAVSTRAVIAGHTRRLMLSDLRTGEVLARGDDPLSSGGTPSDADGTRQQGDLITTWEVAGSTRHRWVHGGWNVGYYAIWQGDLYGFQNPGNPMDDDPMALWIPPTGVPHRFPVTGKAAPLGVTTDGHAVALTGTFRGHALYVLPLRR
ncbi:hypothetical protein OG417_25785 [Actinoallomurus sp. NBC_01490]|uniref:hypothetical protein n=1 Tax=Actinoallomurus sp. NBC_01490 TaxID=2903557 RepID=UPI002E38093B|nr:hypothetical protein [Actinoallomurus sp. NBC_01490]